MPLLRITPPPTQAPQIQLLRVYKNESMSQQIKVDDL